MPAPWSVVHRVTAYVLDAALGAVRHVSFDLVNGHSVEVLDAAPSGRTPSRGAPRRSRLTSMTWRFGTWEALSLVRGTLAIAESDLVATTATGLDEPEFRSCRAASLRSRDGDK